jgi:DNA-binding response OmpR family regulator
MARVRALLRRAQRTVGSGHDEPADELRVADLVVDPLRHRVSVGGNRVECTAGEFALLAVLAGAPERVFTRQQLLQLTRGQDRYITGRTIDVQVSNLRKKLEPDPRNPSRIVTVFGVGYKLTGGDGGS